MLAVNVQQSTLEQALVFYQKHLESLREQQENSLPGNGKAPATAEDLSIDHAFDEQLQTIAGLLESAIKLPEQTTQKITPPPKNPPPRDQTSELRVFDAFDTEPYVNPFTGQLITPETPFSAGTSSSHIGAKAPLRERRQPPILEHIQQQRTVAVIQQTVTEDPKHDIRTTDSSTKPDVGQSRPPSYRSVESVQSFDTRSTVPSARSYASQSASPEGVPVAKSRWGTISRLKHVSSKASFKSKSKKHTEGLHKDSVPDVSPEIHHAFVSEACPTISHTKAATKEDLEKSRQNSGRHLQAKNLDRDTRDDEARFQQNRQTFRRREFLTPSSRPAIAIEPPFPPIFQQGVLSSDLGGHNGSQFASHGHEPIAKTSQKAVYGPPAHERYAKSPIPIALQNPTYLMQSTPVTLVNQKQNPSVRQAERPMAGNIDCLSNLPELDSYKESLKLAFELSGGFPQDYASLKQIQEEHQMSTDFMESERLARELACGLPQDYAAVNLSQSENDNTLEKLRLADIEWQNAFEADRKLAQTLAAEDAPQQIQDFHRADANRQLNLQEEARIAKEIAEREDHAEMEAQLAAARRLQDEWNASEANQLAEEQRLARELSEREDRRELERQNANLQHLQTEEIPPQPTQRMDLPDTSFTAGVRTNDQPPAYTAEAPSSQLPEEVSGRGREVSDPLFMEVATRSAHPQQRGPTNPSNSRDAEELSRIITARRARHGQWKADVEKANQAAKAAEESIRRRAKEDEEEIRRLEQQQRLLAEKAKKEEEARRAAVEAERRSRQAECTVCTESYDKSEMAMLSCKHAYCGACITRKSTIHIHLLPFSHANDDFRSIPARPQAEEAIPMLS